MDGTPRGYAATKRFAEFTAETLRSQRGGATVAKERSHAKRAENANFKRSTYLRLGLRGLCELGVLGASESSVFESGNFHRSLGTISVISLRSSEKRFEQKPTPKRFFSARSAPLRCVFRNHVRVAQICRHRRTKVVLCVFSQRSSFLSPAGAEGEGEGKTTPRNREER